MLSFKHKLNIHEENEERSVDVFCNIKNQTNEEFDRDGFQLEHFSVVDDENGEEVTSMLSDRQIKMLSEIAYDTYFGS